MTPIPFKTYIEFYYAAAWHNCTDVLQDPGPVWEYGLPGSGPLDLVAGTGILTFTLDNGSSNAAGLYGYYSIGHANCPAWFVDGLPVRVRCERQDDMTIATRFVGFMVASRSTSGMYLNDVTEVEVRDWMDFAGNQKIGVIPIENNITADEAITSALTGFPLQPTATSFDAGVETWLTMFSTDNSETMTMMNLFQKIARNEGGGFIYLKGDGTLKFNNRRERIGGAASFSLDPVHDLEVVWDRDRIYNRVECKIYPPTFDAAATTVIWKLQKTFPMAAGETVVLSCPYRDPDVTKRISAMDVVTPLLSGTHIKYGTVDDGSTNDIGAASPELDAYTTTLLHLDGADTSTVMTDEAGKAWTAQGNAQIDTGQSKFGGASLLLDGTTDYLSTPDHADWDLGSGDFTIDFWLRTSSAVAYDTLIGRGINNATAGEWALLINSSGAGDIAFWCFDYNGYASAMLVTAAGLVNTGAWVHIALVRSSNDWTIYVDGVSKATRNSNTTITDAAVGLWIGAGVVTAGRDLAGWIDEFRISKGIARWAADFTPPAYAYSDHITYPMTVGGNSADITLTAATAGFVNFIEIVGRGIHTDEPLVLSAEDATSITARGEKPLSFNLEQMGSASTAQAMADFFLAEYLTPAGRVDRVRFLANFSDAYATAALTVDPNTRFTITEAQTATAADYHACRLRFEQIDTLLWVEIVAAKADQGNFFVWDLDGHGWDEGRWVF